MLGLEQSLIERIDMNRIMAELTIQLAKHIEKTEKNEEFNRYYRFTMPVGAPFEEVILYAKEMVKQIEILQQKAKESEDKAKESEDKVTTISK